MNAPKEELEYLKESLFQGRKIEAIKLYRASTGAELTEAKAAVEAFEKELRDVSPEKFVAPAGNKGCLGVMIVLCVIVALVLVWFLRK